MPEIYPIGGGKGGIGKSFVAASLAAIIARQGKTVGLIDLDLGAANLHTLLGIKNPQNGLGCFLDRQAAALTDVTVPTPVENLFLISSAHCSVEIANLYYSQKTRLIRAIRTLPYDYILLDLGAGSNFNTIDFFVAAHGGLVICTVEPTAIENTFRFVKSVYIRRLKQIIKQHQFNEQVKERVFNKGHAVIGSRDILGIVRQYDPAKEAYLKKLMQKFTFKLIVNQLRKNTDAELGTKMQTVCNQHFYATFQFLGNIHFDDRVFDSVFNKQLFVDRYRDTATSMMLKKIAGAILNNGQKSHKQERDGESI